MGEAAPRAEEWRILDQTEGYKAEKWQAQLAAARDNVETLRKRDVRLRLTDRRGRPLAQRPVRIVQTNSDFLWGFCGWHLLNSFRDGSWREAPRDRERRLLAELFNAVNLMLYWVELHCDNAPSSEEYQGWPDYENLQQGVDWANAQGLAAKGHPIFWAVEKAVPEWLRRYDHQTKLKFLEVRVRSLTARFRHRIRLYDAINEALWEPTLQHTHVRHWPHLEPIPDIAEYIEQVLRWARDEDPDAAYLLNDYGVCFNDRREIPIKANDGTTVTRHEQLQRYVRLAQHLLERGSGPDALGVQGHTEGWGHHDWQTATYDTLGEATGLPVHITEFWAHTRHLEESGMPEDEIHSRLCEYLENFLTCAFGNRHVEAFFFWGGQDQLFKRSRPTKVYHFLRELIRKRWRTELETRTDNDGRLAFRGFCGEYRARLERGPGHPTGHLFRVPAAFPKDVSLDLQLPL
jgi:GH35 family endo-1,4-beta-xylanase